MPASSGANCWSTSPTYSFWLLDIPALLRVSDEALRLAEETGRDDLWADMTAWVGAARQSEGDLIGALDVMTQAVDRAGGIRSFAPRRPRSHCLWDGAPTRRHRPRKVFKSRATGTIPRFTCTRLEHHGLALTGCGRYDEALRVFDEMRHFARQHGVLQLLARGIAMSAGVYMALGDYEQVAATAEEARELARSLAFAPPRVSAGIDLLLVRARQQEPGQAKSVLEEVAAVAASASGWHGWLWRIRLSQARAELALAGVTGVWRSTPPRMQFSNHATADRSTKCWGLVAALARGCRARRPCRRLRTDCAPRSRSLGVSAIRP